MKINLKEISKKQLLQGMNLALKNARSLLKEARLLTKNRAYSRAFALCVLSLEEAGKVVLLTLCYHEDRFKTSQKNANKFLKLFSNHSAKIAFLENYYETKWKSFLYVRKRKHHEEPATLYERLLRSTSDIFSYLRKTHLSSIVELKLKCLYVDSSKKGFDFHMPYRPPAKVVKALLLLTEHHIKDAQILRDTFRRAKTAEISEELYMTMYKDYDMRFVLDELKELEKSNASIIQ
jgi:AbiV family abortive infection protein